MSLFTKLFAARPDPVLAVDIGSSYIKIAQTAKSQEGFKIVKLAARPTPPLAMKDGIITDPGVIAAELKDLVRQSGANLKFAVTAVAGQPVVIRTITMTSMTLRELKNSIKYEAERYIPYSIAEAQVDGMILRNPIPGDEANMEVLLMAAPKEMVRNLEEVVIQAGLQVKAIELEPVALLRLIRMTLGAEVLKTTVAIINIGASCTSINIFNNGILRNSRTISIAGNSFTKAIAQSMNLNFDEAESLKKEKGIIRVEKDSAPVAPTTMRIFNIILPVLAEFVTELQRSFDFYRSRYRGESVDIVFLCGGTSRFKNLDRYLGGELGLRVELFSPLGKAGVPGMSREESEELAQLSAVVLGLSTWHLV